MISRLATLGLLAIVLALVGCSSKEDELRAYMQQTAAIADERLGALKKHIDSERLSNVKLIKQYADYLTKNTPEVAGIASTLATEGTSKGAMYQGLQMRLDDARSEIKRLSSMTPQQQLELEDELSALVTASSANNYNDALADPLNVLADMSGGKLARVGVGSSEDSASANGAKDYGKAASLVGNPNYGQWQQNSNGTSFWAFYGQYRLLSDLLSGPVYYNSWSRHRDYSFYHDRGRNYYSSPKQYRTAQATQKRAESRFKAKGERFSGPYSKTRSQGSTYAKTNPQKSGLRSVTRSPGRLSSSYSSSSKSSSARSQNSSASKSSSRNKSSSYSSRGSSNSSRSYGGRGK